ncbi:hypothetical protein T439DRAFT_357166 [Meredithblackwellia eburnea MCA 4105]
MPIQNKKDWTAALKPSQSDKALSFIARSSTSTSSANKDHHNHLDQDSQYSSDDSTFRGSASETDTEQDSSDESDDESEEGKAQIDKLNKEAQPDLEALATLVGVSPEQLRTNKSRLTRKGWNNYSAFKEQKIASHPEEEMEEEEQGFRTEIEDERAKKKRREN